MKSRDERPRSPRRDDAKAGPRRRVLAAAMEVFAREGYHAARMDAIAEAAGVSKGALYFHFPGKLPLFSALVDEFAAELGADVAAAIAAYQGGVARVEAAVTAALSLFGRRRALARIGSSRRRASGPPTRRSAARSSAASPRWCGTISTRQSPREASRRSTAAWPPTRGSGRSTRSRCSRWKASCPRPRTLRARSPLYCSAPSAWWRRARRRIAEGRISAPRSYPLIHRHPPSTIRRIWRGSSSWAARGAATDRSARRRGLRSTDECTRAQKSSSRERMSTGENKRLTRMERATIVWGIQ